LIAFFFDVGSILAPKMVPKSKQNLKNSVSKLPFDSECFSTHLFDLFFDFRPLQAPQIEPKRRSVARFDTFPAFSLSSILGSILNHIVLHSGWFWNPFPLHFRIRTLMKQKMFEVFFVFNVGSMLGQFGSPFTAPF
jgi:hypothetical protein